MPQAAPQPTANTPLPLPEPSSELVLWRIQTLALLETLGRKKGERFLREMADLMATEDSFAEVERIRAAPDAPKIKKSRREAIAYFDRTLPALLARLR